MAEGKTQVTPLKDGSNERTRTGTLPSGAKYRSTRQGSKHIKSIAERPVHGKSGVSMHITRQITAPHGTHRSTTKVGETPGKREYDSAVTTWGKNAKARKSNLKQQKTSVADSVKDDYLRVVSKNTTTSHGQRGQSYKSSQKKDILGGMLSRTGNVLAGRKGDSSVRSINKGPTVKAKKTVRFKG